MLPRSVPGGDRSWGTGVHSQRRPASVGSRGGHVGFPQASGGVATWDRSAVGTLFPLAAASPTPNEGDISCPGSPGNASRRSLVLAVTAGVARHAAGRLGRRGPATVGPGATPSTPAAGRRGRRAGPTADDRVLVTVVPGTTDAQARTIADQAGATLEDRSGSTLILDPAARRPTLTGRLDLARRSRPAWSPVEPNLMLARERHRRTTPYWTDQYGLQRQPARRHPRRERVERHPRLTRRRRRRAGQRRRARPPRPHRQPVDEPDRDRRLRLRHARLQRGHARVRTREQLRPDRRRRARHARRRHRRRDRQQQPRRHRASRSRCRSCRCGCCTTMHRPECGAELRDR